MTDADYNHLLQRIIALEEDVRKLQNKPAPAAIPAGTLQRGKYIRQTHQSVVARDPDYVVWNADKGYAAGLGFTDAHIAAARELLKSGAGAAKTAGNKKDGPPW